MAQDKSFQDEIPKSRVQIKYKKATDGATQETELPLRMMLVGDYTGRKDATPLEQRKKLNVNKDNFEAVLKDQKLGLDLVVPNTLSGQPGDEMAVKLKFESMKDFDPEAIARQVPELNSLLQLRELLTDLKARVVTNKDFRKALEAIVKDKTKLEALIAELDKVAPVAEPGGTKSE
jgi:type VI secretion system protein ImpB